ncbi:MAG TPA: type II toxin-antitoxin system RelE/ParE family toxin [Spirochaetota bacterium]|nr:type II toxin-antitoxin system RelE/ParE family toxin [Spirochaetota bacterium]HQO03555.1 type II toxin-antitoxin system RelE/ParE family toxin [Spirochaetota bacterium]
MNFIFHPDAVIELDDAVAYYEEIETGLGIDLAAEVYSAVQRACTMPGGWTTMTGDVRRSLVKRFPYGVLYSHEDGFIFIIAVMHLHRDPEYWKDRV